MSTLDLENPQPKPGDALRDEAGNLLATKYGRPQREQIVEGKRVDLYFVRREHGKDVHYFVEAKDYARNLDRDEANHIWSDYEGLVCRPSAPGILLLITRSGLTPGAEAFIRSKPFMRHQTIWELENELLGLTDYIRNLTTLFDQEGLASYYIEGRARAITYTGEHERVRAESDGAIFDTLTAWLDSDETQPIAILGGYGAGKSSLAKRLVSHQAKRALEDPLARRPVLYKLGGFTRYSSLEGMLGGMFTHEFPVNGFNTHHFLDLSDKGRLLHVLDGFDEMKHAMSWADFHAQVRSLNRLTHGRSKVVLLGRPSAFTSTDEHHHVLRGLKRHDGGWRQLPDWPEFQEYDLEEFTPVERAEFVRRYLRHLSDQRAALGRARISDDVIVARAAEVNRLADLDPEIFGKPVHAKILTDLAADHTVDLSKFANGVSRWRLYETFFASLAEREAEKDARREIGADHRLEFLREVAFWLWTSKGGSISFHADALPTTLLSQMHAGAAPDIDALRREYLTGAFLEKKAADTYFFGHRSFAEFLVAQRMVLKPPGDAHQQVYSGLVRDGVATFLREAPDQNLIRAWEATLSSARGEIHLEYLSFLADAFGGLAPFMATLPPTSIWLRVLAVFTNRIEFDDGLLERVVPAMLAPENPPLFLLLWLFQASSARRSMPVSEGQTLLAAALLERVFDNAVVDDHVGKAYVDPSRDDARDLAQKVMPAMSDQFGVPYLVFRGSILLEARREWERKHGVALGAQAPLPLLAIEPETLLNWADVQAHMSERARDAAVRYFRRSKNLRGVFTRDARGRTRSTPRPRQFGG